MVIREAMSADIGKILPLLNEVSDIHGINRGDIFIDKPRHITKDKLEKYIKDNKHIVLVCVIDNELVGVMLGKIKDIKDDIKYRDCRIMSLEDTCIKEELRSMHIGQFLLDELKKIAQKTECARIESNSWAFNKPSYYYLMNNGFSIQRYVWEFKIDSSDSL